MAINSSRMPHLQRGQRDAEGLQQQLTAEGETGEDGEGDETAAQGHGALGPRAGTVGHRRIEHGHVHRPDGGEEGGEGDDEGFDQLGGDHRGRPSATSSIQCRTGNSLALPR